MTSYTAHSPRRLQFILHKVGDLPADTPRPMNGLEVAADHREPWKRFAYVGAVGPYYQSRNREGPDSPICRDTPIHPRGGRRQSPPTLHLQAGPPARPR